MIAEVRGPVRRLDGALLLLLWLAIAAAMWRSAVQDPYDALLTGSARYGHNGEGALRWGLIAITVELTIALAVLQPWRRDRRAAPAGVALLLSVPWALVSMIMSMHTGGVLTLHWVWCDLLVVYILVQLILALWRVGSRRPTA